MYFHFFLNFAYIYFRTVTKIQWVFLILEIEGFVISRIDMIVN